MLVFTYGTLMSGNHNHYLMEDYDAKLVAAGTIQGVQNMTYVSFPVLFKDGNETAYGELYEIAEDALPTLDRLESNGTMYQREKVSVDCDGIKSEAWCYFGIPKFWQDDELKPYSGKWSREKAF